MGRRLSWLFLLPALFGLCVAPNAWGQWADLFDRFNNARPGARMVDLHQLVESEARRHRLPAHYVAAILHIESAAQPCRYRRNGCPMRSCGRSRHHGVRDRFNPIEAPPEPSIADAFRLAGGDPRLAAAVYNAGSRS